MAHASFAKGAVGAASSLLAARSGSASSPPSPPLLSFPSTYKGPAFAAPLYGICTRITAKSASLRVSAASAVAAEKPSVVPEIVLQPIKEISGTVKLPGSKSLSNRILLLAALSEVFYIYFYIFLYNRDFPLFESVA